MSRSLGMGRPGVAPDLSFRLWLPAGKIYRSGNPNTLNIGSREIRPLDEQRLIQDLS